MNRFQDVSIAKNVDERRNPESRFDKGFPFICELCIFRKYVLLHDLFSIIHNNEQLSFMGYIEFAIAAAIILVLLCVQSIFGMGVLHGMINMGGSLLEIMASSVRKEKFLHVTLPHSLSGFCHRTSAVLLASEGLKPFETGVLRSN